MEYANLKEYSRKMQQIADECVHRILKGQEDGLYVIKISNLKNDFDMNSLDEDLLLEMLSERDEISIKDSYNGNITVEVMPEYIPEAKQTNLKVISDHELRVMLAKHYLWLYDEYGGVQADLSNHYVENFNFSGRDLCSAVLNGAKFVNCSFHNTSMCSAECVGTVFNSCNLMDITSEESNFNGADFRYCRMDRGVYTHSNFHLAKFVQNEMSGVSFMNSCIANTEWIDNDTHSINMKNVKQTIDEWDGDVPGEEMKWGEIN